MKMCHVTITVQNLDDSVRFYQDVVGLPLQNRFTAGVGIEIAFLGDGETKIELLWEQNHKEVFVGSDISIGFGVENAQAKREQLLAKNIEASTIVQPSPETKFFFITDPNGVKIQFIEG